MKSIWLSLSGFYTEIIFSAARGKCEIAWVDDFSN